MKLSISKKFAKRSIKCLALFAPIAYLFGSLFFGLNGAHGAFPYSAEYEVVTSSVTYDFNQLKENGNLESGSDGYRVYNGSYLSQTYDSTVPSLDYSIVNNTASAGYQYSALVSISSAVIGHVYVAKASIYSASFTQFQLDIWGDYYIYNKTGDTYWTRWTATNEADRIFIRPRADSFVVGDSFTLYSFQVFDLTNIYGQGNEKSYADFVIDFPNGYYDYTLSEKIVVDTYGVPDNGQYVFNQFFGKDNFLEQWGRNAISSYPVGFAPFGAFFKFIDENMLHLSDSQIGLMGYGYIYYCLHVLIAFLAFDCVAFIPQLIMKVVHQFNKGVDTDD